MRTIARAYGPYEALASTVWFTTPRCPPGKDRDSVTLLVLTLTYVTLTIVLPASLGAAFVVLAQLFNALLPDYP